MEAAGSLSKLDYVDAGLRAHMAGIYRILAVGLTVSAATSWATTATPLYGMMVTPEGISGLGWALMLAPLGLLIAASFGMLGRSAASWGSFYWIFVALQGPGLALVASQYTDASVVKAATAAAAFFGAASLYGHTTGRNLESLGAFMFVGLIALVIASVVNLFLASPAADWALSCIAVVIFTGLTAYETQEAKRLYDTGADRHLAKYMTAIGLYLNVINLFNALLSLTGQRE